MQPHLRPPFAGGLCHHRKRPPPLARERKNLHDSDDYVLVSTNSQVGTQSASLQSPIRSPPLASPTGPMGSYICRVSGPAVLPADSAVAMAMLERHPDIVALEAAGRRACVVAALGYAASAATSESPAAERTAVACTGAAAALALYVKALNMLRAVAGMSLLALGRGNPQFEHKGGEQHASSEVGDTAAQLQLAAIRQFVTAQFGNVLERAECCRGQLSGDSCTLCAEALIWQAAVAKSRISAAQELIGAYSRSREGYFEALVLLEALGTAAEHGGAAAGPLSEADAGVLQRFMALINSRLAIVATAGAVAGTGVVAALSHQHPAEAQPAALPVAATAHTRDSLAQHL